MEMLTASLQRGGRLDFSGFDHVPIALAVIDPAGCVRVWNGAAQSLSGWSAGSVIGHSPPWVPADRMDEFSAVHQRVRLGETIRDFCTERVRRDGTRMMLRMTLAPLVDDLGGTWVILSAEDISEEWRLRQQLNDGRRKFRDVAEQLRRAQTQREQLIRLLVHDFKGPIAVTLASMRFINGSRGLDEDGREALNDAIASCESLHQMTLNLLDICRSEDGTLIAKRKPTDVTKLVQDEIQQCARLGRNPVVLLACPGTEAEVDPELLRRVVRNLVDNAYKYGGAEPVTVTCNRDPGGALELTVSDLGPGIPPESRERIFEKYFRVEGRSENVERQSHGLGLTFCKLAVEAHGGTIRVTENEPHGCRFVVTLPAG